MMFNFLNEYVKQCDDKIIKTKWEVHVGNLYWNKKTKSLHMINENDDIGLCEDKEIVWLPRLEDLIVMIGKNLDSIQRNLLNEWFVRYWGKYNSTTITGDTPEIALVKAFKDINEKV